MAKALIIDGMALDKVAKFTKYSSLVVFFYLLLVTASAIVINTSGGDMASTGVTKPKVHVE